MNTNWIHKNKALLGAARLARRILGRGWMRAAHACGTKRNTVFFSSFQGKAYSDSPRAISEALHAMDPGIDIVWQLYDRAGAPDFR